MKNENSCSTTDWDRRYLRMYWTILLAVAVLIAGITCIPKESLGNLLKEDGPVEILSGVGYFVCVLVFLVLFRGRAVRLWYFPFIFLAMGFRELDFHVRFTTINMTKLKYYLPAGGVPWDEKLVVMAIVGFIGFACLVMLRRHLPGFRNRFRERHVPTVGAALAGVMTVWSLIADKLPKKLRLIGVSDESVLMRFVDAAEEVGELSIPYLILVAIFAAARAMRREATAGPES